MDATIALEAAVSNPSLIKRPLIVKNENMVISYDEQQMQDLLT
jgi:arsenate reductase-like glutaredoxin family protein